jgi:hypothetical protein
MKIKIKGTREFYRIKDLKRKPHARRQRPEPVSTGRTLDFKRFGAVGKSFT